MYLYLSLDMNHLPCIGLAGSRYELTCLKRPPPLSPLRKNINLYEEVEGNCSGTIMNVSFTKMLYAVNDWLTSGFRLYAGYLATKIIEYWLHIKFQKQVLY